MAVFTDNYIKSLKPKEKPYRESDGKSGFCIWVATSGTKTFLYRYKVNGKDSSLSLGQYKKEVTLQEARNKFEIAQKAVKNGLDPRAALAPPPEPEHVPTPQVTTPDHEGMTLRELMELFMTEWADHNLSKRWSRANRLALEKDLMPVWGDKKPSDLKPRDTYKLVDAISRRAPASARNFIKAARAMYDYAVRHEYVDFNPFALNFAKNSPVIVPQPRERVLDEEEIKFIWKAIDDGPGEPEVKRAIKLVLVTGQRPEGVVGIRFSEIDDNWWTIPPVRIKTEKKVGLKRAPRPHVIYLTPLAKELIGEPGWSGDVVFPSVKGHNKRKENAASWKRLGVEHKPAPIKPLTENALSKRISKQDVKGPKGKKVVTKEPYYGLPRWTPHDLRRTADTMMNAIGIDNRHVEMVLNHSLGKVEKVYNRYEYNNEKKEALLKWEQKLREIIER